MQRVVRVPIGLFRVEPISAEVTIACAARIGASSTDNGHRSLHVTCIIEASAQDGFINFRIIKFYGILIETVASSR